MYLYRLSPYFNEFSGGELQYKVPQNIDMQDRILGPLTMLQFIEAVIGGGICYGIFSVVPKPFSFLLIVPIALFVGALIFLKINERPFLDFLTSAFEYFSRPKQRVWHHDNSPDLTIEVVHTQKDVKPAYQTKNFSHEQIQNVAQRLDQ